MHLQRLRSPLRNRGRLEGAFTEPVCRKGDELKREPQPPFEGLIRSREAARLLGMSEWSLRNLVQSGQIAYIQRTPRSPLLFDPLDLRKWVEREKIHSPNGNSR